MSFDLVIFDCDGVLVDSEPLANRVFRDRLEEVGVVLSLEEVMRQFIGRTRAGCMELATQLLGRTLPPDFGGRWDRILYETLERELKVVAGVSELLRALRVPYCVATNS